MSFLSGKKTYLVAIAAGAVIAAQQLGWLDAEAANTILAALGVGGAVTLRQAIAKAGG
ncbi:MAG: hypothetical protein U1A72_16885 [Sulfuritalea sp.]|nr:hypothetical protein [Sulfuritalea sp.]